jgi:hypothetical protein
MPEQRKTIKAIADVLVELLNRLTGLATILLAIAMVVRGVYHDAKIEKKIDQYNAARESEFKALKQLILEKMGDKKELWEDTFLHPSQR